MTKSVNIPKIKTREYFNGNMRKQVGVFRYTSEYLYVPMYMSVLTCTSTYLYVPYVCVFTHSVHRINVLRSSDVGTQR